MQRFSPPAPTTPHCSPPDRLKRLVLWPLSYLSSCRLRSRLGCHNWHLLFGSSYPPFRARDTRCLDRCSGLPRQLFLLFFLGQSSLPLAALVLSRLFERRDHRR